MATSGRAFMATPLPKYTHTQKALKLQSTSSTSFTSLLRCFFNSSVTTELWWPCSYQGTGIRHIVWFDLVRGYFIEMTSRSLSILSEEISSLEDLKTRQV